MIELEKAAAICKQVAAHRKRWGRHAGFGGLSEAQVLDALVAIDEAGLFELVGEKDARIAANRQKGAAEARAVGYKKKLDEARAEIEELKKRKLF